MKTTAKKLALSALDKADQWIDGKISIRKSLLAYVERLASAPPSNAPTAGSTSSGNVDHVPTSAALAARSKGAASAARSTSS